MRDFALALLGRVDRTSAPAIGTFYRPLKFASSAAIVSPVY